MQGQIKPHSMHDMFTKAGDHWLVTEKHASQLPGFSGMSSKAQLRVEVCRRITGADPLCCGEKIISCCNSHASTCPYCFHGAYRNMCRVIWVRFVSSRDPTWCAGDAVVFNQYCACVERHLV